MTVDTVSLENRVLAEGQSSELAACFQIIQEATVDDVDKYPEKICRELARTIVCRTYASAVHELCHLAVAAACLEPQTRRFENLFWNTGAARARNFHAFFQAGAEMADNLDIDTRQVTITYADKPFTVTFGRMPFLSALMEFLMTALGYTDLDDTLTPLNADFPAAGDVSNAANELSRKLYAYLHDHLPPVQEQRKHRGFLQFIATRAAGEAALAAIDDDAVLEYWLDQSANDSDEAGTDSRTYRNVFKTAARLLHILRLAADKQGIAVALPIGTDHDAGEVDPAELETAVAEIDEASTPVAALEAASSGGVKMLNKRELETLRQALHGEDAAQVLTGSILRNAVFGDVQARLTQALRKGLKATELKVRIESEPENDYSERMQAFAELAVHIERMVLICFHVLYQNKHRDAVNAALVLRPDMNLSDMAPEDDDSNVVSFQAEHAMRRFFNAAEEDGPISVLAAEAAKAAKGIARQGFSEAAWNNPTIIDVFAASVAELAHTQRELTRFLERHAAAIDWQSLFDSDTSVFRGQFMRIYGGQDD
jgi:hypothetical protein